MIKAKRVIILGGDGYIGWPAAMRFSNLGYEVLVIDNYFRRNISKKETSKIGFLFEVPDLVSRAKIWFEKTGNQISVLISDLTSPDVLRSLLGEKGLKLDWPKITVSNYSPETIIHYAEQPSAPYSQLSNETANFTLNNNLITTNNLLFSVKDFCPSAHIIKLGTMGEYGTPNIDIEEGWINIKKNNREDRFLFPRQASSIYHTSKIMDTDLIWFAVRTWGLRVTDLMQGPVYGLFTSEMKIDNRLGTFFNYDEFFGTVVNRFITQSVIGHPLTIYGSGNQIRGYLNLEDSIECVRIASDNPPEKGELKIYNQIMETLSVNQIAEIVLTSAKKLGIETSIEHILNPRVEKEEHYYNPVYQALKDLGIKPTLLSERKVVEIMKHVINHKSKINNKLFFNGSKW